ncbi:MAG: GTP cyclohydrolase I FolE [Candidatus Melainabacteria bacterium HGW-Melainabacteria-1]|nr:MAG: GTP cyclohydrolase I FolE [Candidatus Melainabacteria bacterium HGW-Melainabacteria-1]
MSLDPNKVDPQLGKEIFDYLSAKGVETPRRLNGISQEDKIAGIQQAFITIMDSLGLNLEDDSLSGTPLRVAKMFVQENFWGLNPDYFPKITAVANKMGYDEVVLEKNIVVQSTCEHHFVMIDGYAHVAYIPAQKVLGLSKLNRVVEYFSRRPQIQERLTEQIYYALEHILETPDIAVMIHAKHYCVKARGVQDINSETITSKLGGCFKDDPASRQEFLTLVRTQLQ